MPTVLHLGQKPKTRGGDVKSGTLTYLLAITLSVGLAIGARVVAQGNPGIPHQQRYFAYTLGAPLGGSASGAAAINEMGWVAGDSNLKGDKAEHAELWAYGLDVNLGTLGGPNSAVLWPGLNNRGEIVGVSDTSKKDPLGEIWSCGAFFLPSHAGHTCVGFLWRDNKMTALPTLGGNNGFATAINDRGEIVGWAENKTHDPTCVSPQVLQFEAVIWGPKKGQIMQLSPFGNDPDGAATGINDQGQVVGISGICQNAVGNLSAKHALLWVNGVPTDLGNLGGVAWNTPMAINNRGQVVGFSDRQGDKNGNNPNFHAFLWTKEKGIQDLGTLRGDRLSEALGINNKGQIVGVSYAAGFTNPRAFIWENGKITDLNSLVSSDSGLTLQVAQEINDSGVIVGQAVNQGTGQCGTTSAGCAFVAIPAR
jgi:probable HAF family extracellular repeat protein